MTLGPLTVLYGTETGMAEEIAYMAAWDAIARGFTNVRVAPADDVPVDKWVSDGAPILFVVSTTGQGEMPQTIRKTWARLRDPKSAPVDIDGLRFAVFGLGDSSYWKYNYSGKMLHNLLKKLGGEPIVHRGLGDEDDGQGHYQALMPWLEQLFAAMGYMAPQRSEASETPTSAGLDPLPASTTPLYLPDIGENRFAVALNGAEEATTTTAPPSGIASKFTPVRVAATARLTDPTHFQEVRHIDLERPAGFAFECGDVLGVLSPNTDDAVANALRVLGLRAEDRILITLSPHLPHQPARSFLNQPALTVETLLRYHFDLAAPAPQSFLRQLARHSRNDEERERLSELSAPTRLIEYINYCYRERRTCIEVLEDFPAIKLPIESFVSHCKLMQSRYFSISSSPSADLGVLSLTVAKFEITTPYGRERAGLCSSYLCSRQVGDVVHVFLDKRPFGIPFDKPCLLIGPGTGVAPLRSVIRERTHYFSQPKSDDDLDAPRTPPQQQSLLLFGCRNEKKDFLYHDEYPSEKGLSVVTAFSRDIPNRKVYVQHRMTESATATQIFNILRNDGHIVVCGNAKHMPNSVFKALTAILVAGKVPEEDAEAFLHNMKAEKTLVFDTWSV